MLRRSLHTVMALMVAVLLVIAGCGSGSKTGGDGATAPPAQQEAPKPAGEQPAAQKGPNGETYGGTFRVAIGSEPAGIDPQIDTTLQVYTLSRNIFNTLVRYKGDTLELEPELLTAMPTVDADNVTYHFKLRDDVTFTNGQKLTAKDVKFTFERMLNPATKAQNGWVLEEIEGAEAMMDGAATELSGLKVTGDYTFDIILKRPFGPFLTQLATPPTSIFPTEYTQQAGDNFQRAPIGSGPFKVAEWKPNELIVLERNPDYFEKGYPFLDKVEYRVIAEEATRWLEFEKGSFDESGIPNAEFGTATTSGKWTVLESVPLNTYYIAMSLDHFPDKRVREAVSLAIDRDTILQAVLHGQGTVAKQFVTPGIPGALTNPTPFKYDPQRAKDLLKEAGAEGITVESWQRGGDKVSDTNLAIQQMLKEVGINYEVYIADSATYRETRATGEIPANYGNWWADFPDPDNYLYTFFYSSSSKSMSVNYNDSAVDKILEDARGLADQAARQKMYQDLEQRLVYDEFAIIPLFHLKEYSLTQKNVHGVLAHPTGVGGLKTVWKN